MKPRFEKRRDARMVRQTRVRIRQAKGNHERWSSLGKWHVTHGRPWTPADNQIGHLSGVAFYCNPGEEVEDASTHLDECEPLSGSSGWNCEPGCPVLLELQFAVRRGEDGVQFHEHESS